MSYQVHETAVVDKGAVIGDGTRIWHFVHICAEAEIGNDVSLGQGVFVGSNVRIGDRCKIQNGVSVYDNVTLEEGVFCGPSMVFTNVNNPRALIEKKDQYEDTLVKRGASLGANCTVVCGVTVGDYAFVGAGAVVNRDVRPYALVVGVPAVQVGWVSQYGERMPMPLQGKGEFRCAKTQAIYRLDSDGISVELL